MALTLESWPIGRYGLPKAKTGCPDSTWKEGWRRQDLDDKTNVSSNIHMDVQLENDGNIRRSFCLKIMNTGTKEWPKGEFLDKYCHLLITTYYVYLSL